MDAQPIFAIERPNGKLLTYYFIQSFLLPPISLLALPYLFFRYHTMRYRIDDEGISMSWGVLFRKQINLTYARIQDIHLTSGVIQRWLGLADIHIQTASGSAGAEMKIEGILEFEEVRNFLYTRMRGYRRGDGKESLPPPIPSGHPAATGTAAGTGDTELVSVMRELGQELRTAREALETIAAREREEPPHG